MKHLYIQTAFLGDLLLATPTLKQIRSWDVKSEITLLCRKGFGSFIKDLGLCDHVLEMDKKAKGQVFLELEKLSFDYLFCPHQSLTSFSLAQSVRAKHKVGYFQIWNSGVFNDRVKRRLDWPEALRQMQLLGQVSESFSLKLEAFSQKPDTIPVWSQMHLPQLFWGDKEIKTKIKSLGLHLKETSPYIVIAPGSVWATKRWPEKYFVKTASELAKQGFQIVIIGAPEERELGERIKSQVSESYNLAGSLSLKESLMFLAHSQGLICNDSGAMHMASLLHLPTIALFGPTVQELGYKPWNPNAQVLEQRPLLCRPCGQHGAHVCPIKTHRCMLDTLPQEVLHKAADLFSKS